MLSGDSLDAAGEALLLQYWKALRGASQNRTLSAMPQIDGERNTGEGKFIRDDPRNTPC